MRTIPLCTGMQIDEKSFFIDVLYFSGTSHSKSLYPTIARLFNKEVARIFPQGGMYTSDEENITETGKYDGLLSSDIYYIKRVTYTRI